MTNNKLSSALNLIIVTLFCANNHASTFTIQISHPTRQMKTTTTTHQHTATIIGWDEESNSYKSTFDDMDYMGSSNNILNQDIDSTTTTAQYEFTSIADHLSHDQERTASLARLAVAFSPPERAVNLKDINHIQIIKVASDRIELSAVVCDETECITLFIPVAFPHECGCCGLHSSSSSSCTTTTTTTKEECVLNNIFVLDMEAQQVLKQRELEEKKKEQQSDQQKDELMAALYNNQHNVEFPSWWVTPKTRDMADECQQVKSILNQDEFQHQVKALATEGLSFCDDGDLFEIVRAVVCSIGPAGFYFRAIATKKDEITTVDLSKGSVLCEDTSCTILDIPFKVFDESSTNSDPAALRAAVIGAVTSISD